MAKVLYESDARPEVLKNRKVAILGYGSQGHAHAQNLDSSVVAVVFGLHAGSLSNAVAENDVFIVKRVPEAVAEADVVMFLMPDHVQAKVFETEVRPALRPGTTLGFSHGFTIHYGQIVPPQTADVFMVAPKSPGHLVRRMYTEGKGVPGLLAVYQDATGMAREIGMAYAAAIGCARAGVSETT